MIRTNITLALCGLAAMTSLATAPAFGQAHALETVQQAKQVRQALEYGARCLLDDRPGAVQTFLAKYPGSKDAARSAASLSKGDCVDGSSGPQQLTFSATVLRGALFKQLYAAKFGKGAPVLRASSPEYRYDAGSESDPTVIDYVVSRKFVECVVRKNPAAAHSLMLADAETTAERIALAKVQPSFEPCSAQMKLPEISRNMVVGLIAEVMYRLADAGGGSRV